MKLLFFVLIIFSIANIVMCEEPFIKCVRELEREYGNEIEDYDFDSLLKLSDRISECSKIIEQYNRYGILEYVVNEDVDKYKEYYQIILIVLQKYSERIRKLREELRKRNEL